MYELQGLTKDTITDIYKNIVLMSIKSYENMMPDEQKGIEWKYEKALELKKELGLQDKSLNLLEHSLDDQKKIIEKIRENNQPIIDQLADKIIEILKQEIPKNMSYEERTEFIFDFVLNYVNYAEEWNKYCYKLPHLEKYDFSFYNGIPVSISDKGFLVTKEVMCREIANLLVELGKHLDTPIYKEEYIYNNNMHAFNYIVVNNEKLYMNATMILRERATKVESFLLPRDKVDKEQETKRVLKQNTKYNIKDAVNKVNSISYNVKYLK